MIDTSAAPNLIKRGKLKHDVSVNDYDQLRLTGITDGQVETLGSITTNIAGRKVKLHIISDDFPISWDGILRTDFLYDAGKIDFTRWIVDWDDTSFPFG